MSGIPVYFVDAFASEPFRGNPAAVCLLDPGCEPRPQWMQSVAAEINLSETAFVNLETGQLRWFTPALEVDLCGHATLAAAFAMREHGVARTGETIEFESRSGRLLATLLENDQVELDFPATPPKAIEPSPLLQQMFPDAIEFHQSCFDLLVRFPTESHVRQYQPDFGELGKLDRRGVMVTAVSDPNQGVDFVSRFFAPAAGVNEDPVTGSAHCCLAPYWSRQLSTRKLKALQLSPRGGQVEMVLLEDRVKLIGSAVLVIQGALIPNADSQERKRHLSG